MKHENIHRYKASPPRYGTAALLVSTFLFLAACTAPDGPNHHSVKRDFEWTIDTIRYEGATQLFFSNLAATRDGRVYASASCNSSNIGGKFWGFIDGKWRSIPIDQRTGGQISGKVHRVHGLHAAQGASRVWLTGEKSSPDPATGRWIRHGYLASYDGARFTNLDLFDVEEILGVYALRDDLVYFGSLDDSALFRYDGNEVKRYPLPVSELSKLSEHNISRLALANIAGSERKLILKVSIHYGPLIQFKTVYLVFEDKSTWKVGIPSVSHVGSEPSGGLWTSPEGNVYTCEDRSVFRFESGSWVEIYESPWAAFSSIWGVSDRDFWASGFSTLYHFAEGGDGVPHFPIPIPPAPQAYVFWVQGWTNGREAFVIGQPWIESDMGIIAHGK